MSILWCGGEDFDFPARSSVNVNTNASYRRSAYSRCALQPSGGGFAETPSFGSRSSAWVGDWVFFSDNRNNGQKLQLFDGFAKRIAIQTVGGGLNAPGSFQLVAGVTVLQTSGLTGGQSGKLTLAVERLDAGAECRVRLWQGDTLHIDFTGDVATPAGGTTFDRLRICETATLYVVAYHSEVIIADEDVRLFSLLTLAPNAAGSVNTFTAGSYLDIDETVLSDADTAYSQTPEQDLQVALSDVPAGNFIVKNVRVISRLADGVGGMGMQQGLVTNGVLHLAATRPLAAGWEPAVDDYPQNPETLNRWSLADLNALQLAFRSKAV